MRVEHEGQTYRLGFARYKEEGKDGVVTEAHLLTRQQEKWIPVKAAKVRQWHSRSGKHVDDPSKEEGRRQALEKLGKTLPRPLKGKVMQAYYNRPHPLDPKAISIKIAFWEAQLRAVQKKEGDESAH